VAAASPGAGLNPAETPQFFRDQIEASKVVQRKALTVAMRSVCERS
jgi:hypothetical protein